MTENKPTIEKQVETIDNTKLSLPFSVILFNDDFHTFDEVILQLMKAT